MKIKSVNINNFLSIKQAFIKFDNTGMILVDGWNYDVDRANGAGKSAIFNAIAFALYEKLPRKISATEVLHRGSKNGWVEVVLQSGEEEFIVRRSRPKGVTFYRSFDGKNKEQFSVTQVEWEAKLQLNYNQFIVSMYCAQNNVSRFLLLNDTDKKTFLLQLLNLEEFLLCKKKADEKVQKTSEENSLLTQESEIIQSKIEAHSESLIDSESISTLIKDKKKTIVNFLDTIKTYQAVLKPDLSKYQKLEEDFFVKKSEFIKARANRDALHLQWNSLNNKKPLKKNNVCTLCGSRLEKTNVTEVHVREMAVFSKDLSIIKTQIDELDNFLFSEKKIADFAEKVKEEKRKKLLEYEKATKNQSDLTAQVNLFSLEIKELQSKLETNSLLQEKINSLKERKLGIQDVQKVLSQKIEIQKTVSSVYSSTGAQAYVLDSAVNLFNEYINKFIGTFWSNLTYELLSYKENVKGDMTAKFSESIVMDGKPISIGSLSGGELKALSICTDMALIKVVECQFGINMSPIIFDEAFDGLDMPGKEFALTLIKELSVDHQVVIIDHASEMRSSFDKVIRVEKRNGISTVSQEIC